MKLTATVDKILSVYVAEFEEFEIDVLCTDGRVRKLSNKQNSDNLEAIDYIKVIPGYKFEYESEILPYCINTDYKTVYATIDDFLHDSKDILIGKVMRALKGRINPAEAQKIINERLLLDK